eukprot:CAMPEP_0116006468 /NCGR_PEP_ID=MMETSP0321-20121206/1745_1 /TAXON_ID=163516 /ORGANISM="Leptocylindrus danicus var. danicus, Strain B650" /LENGTH=199 /DNA_ID=CAMNT_0003475025 /DNA_START=10 /DNA_END=606 /DNA_ORIENTATION=+
MALLRRIKQNSKPTKHMAMTPPDNITNKVFIVDSISAKNGALLGFNASHGCSMVKPMLNKTTNMEGAMTRMVAIELFKGGFNVFNLNCISVHRAAEQIADPAHSRNPNKSNSNSPKEQTMNSPNVINKTTVTMPQLNGSSLKNSANASVNTGEPDLIARLMLLSPMSSAVTAPQGMEMLQNSSHDMFCTRSPPKKSDHF